MAILMVIFTVIPATFLAQAEEAATASTLDVTVQVEMDRRFNDFRSKYLDDRADSINWWLGSIAIALAFFGVVVAVAGFMGFQRFRYIETEARKHVDEIKAHKTQAEKYALAIREMDSKYVDEASPTEVKQVEKAVEQIRQTANPSPIDKGIADAYLLQKAGKTKEAIEKWRSIANLAEGIDNDAAARAWFSVGYLVEEPKEKISAYSQAIRLNPGSVNSYDNRGTAKTSLKQYEAAIRDFNEAIRLEPKDAVAYYNRGNAKADLKQYETAIQDFNQAIHLNPEDAAAYGNRGIAKVNLKQYKAAIEDFNEAIHLEPKDAVTYSNRGNAKTNLEQYKAAIQDFNEAIRLEPEDAITYYNRGIAKTNLEQYKAAIQDFNEAIRLGFKNAVAYGNRGIAKTNLEQYKAAIQDFNEAIQLNTNDAILYTNRGIAKASLGHIDKARSDLQTALHLAQEAGNDKLAAEISNEISKIENLETK